MNVRLIWLAMLCVSTAGATGQVRCGCAGAKIELTHHAAAKGFVSMTTAPNGHFTDDRLGDYLVFRSYAVNVDRPGALGATFHYDPAEIIGDESSVRVFRRNPDHSWAVQPASRDEHRRCLTLDRLPSDGVYGIGYRFDRTEYALRIQVIDRDSGKPASGAKVSVSTRPNVPKGGCFFYLTADEHGVATIRLPRVKYWVSSNGLPQWHEGAPQPFLLTGPTTRTVKVFPGLTVKGRVLDEEGNPVPNAKVEDRDVGPDGSFVLEGLSNRTLDIWAEVLVPWERSVAGENQSIHWTDQRLLGLGRATLDPTSGEVEIRMRPVGRLVPVSPPIFYDFPWGMPPEEGCLVRLTSPRGSYFVSLKQFVQNEGMWLPAGEFRASVTTPRTSTDLGTVTIRGASETKLDMKNVFPDRARWSFTFQPLHSSTPTITPLAYISWRVPNAWALAKRLQKAGR